MLFKEADTTIDNKNLEEIIIANSKKAKEIKHEINESKKAVPVHLNQKSSRIQSKVKEDVYQPSQKEENTEYEDEIQFYISNYKSLDIDFSYDDLVETLPSKNDYNYKDILMRLYMESVKEIKELSELINSDDFGKDDVICVKELIQSEQRKMKLLKQIYFNPNVTDLVAENIENEIILVPTKTGKIRIIDEIENQPIESYGDFRDLINSIKNGTFKKVKAFTNNSDLNSTAEVRQNQARIIFKRVGKRKYALITAFTKKTNVDSAYHNYIKTKISEFRSLEDKLKSNLDKDEFIRENELNLEILEDILSSKDSTPRLKKGQM